MTAVLPPVDVAGRVPRLRARLEDAGCDALLLTRMVNIRYLTGFTGSAGLLLVGPDDLVLVTDGRYGEQATEELAAAGVRADVVVGRTLPEQRALVTARAGGLRRLGLEAESVTWGQHRRFASEWFPLSALVATEGLVEDLRRVKDDGEIARMAEAAAVADEALRRVRPMLAEGPTEREFAIALDHEMNSLGAERPSFDTIVAAGPNGAKPHARPGDRRIAPGELVVIDFGAMVDGYCSDMTRTVCVGQPATPEAARMAEVVAESQRSGVAAVAGGVPAKVVDQACRAVIAEAGWADAFLHGTGHGVGLEIHEAPRVSQTSADTLAPGHVVTVEPGVYLPELGGVRIEDTVVVVPGGSLTLTQAPKELLVA
ncbi:MAG: Xaa-Pro peptidase family protein [Actinomycetota bacterium]|nr:Xaa-Pro peptidase family protein [Actinomycetota bacterium]